MVVEQAEQIAEGAVTTALPVEMMGLGELRQALVLAREEVRLADDGLSETKLRVEDAIIVEVCGENRDLKKLAPTVDAQKAALNLRTLSNPSYLEARERQRAAQTEVEAIQARIDTYQDERRDHEWAIRLGLVMVLGKAYHVRLPHLTGEGSDQDSSGDVALDGELDRLALRDAAHNSEFDVTMRKYTTDPDPFSVDEIFA